MDDLARLAAELQALAGPLTALVRPVGVEREGTDPREAVTVALDRQGRVKAVRPHARWAERVAAREFGSAVLHAVHAALGAGLDERRASSDPLDAATPGRPVTSPDPAGLAPLLPFDPRALVGDLLDAFDQLDVMAERLDAIATPTTTPSVPRDIRVQLSARGDVAAVAVNPDWLGRTNLTRLAERATDAFAEAYDELDKAGHEPPFALDLSPRLRALIADPAGAIAEVQRATASST